MFWGEERNLLFKGGKMRVGLKLIDRRKGLKLVGIYLWSYRWIVGVDGGYCVDFYKWIFY